MKRRIIIGMAAAVVVVVVAVLLAVGGAPALSGVTSRSCIASADDCLRFPVISGENLPGQQFNLPADFAGTQVLVIVPFDEAQQVSARRWLPLAQELAENQPDFRYYNVPVFPSISAPVRAFIRAGMTLTIPDAELRSLTITVFLDDREAFLAALDIPTADAMQVFLLNADGEVIWRGAGEFTSEQGDRLRALFD